MFVNGPGGKILARSCFTVNQNRFRMHAQGKDLPAELAHDGACTEDRFLEDRVG